MDSTDSGPDALKQSLQQLHTQLAGAPNVDESSRRLMQDVLADIEGLLREGATPESGAAPHRLEAVAVEFEAAHPTLAASVREFIDLLGQVGL